jgi:hypothetical protein
MSRPTGAEPPSGAPPPPRGRPFYYPGGARGCLFWAFMVVLAYLVVTVVWAPVWLPVWWR